MTILAGLEAACFLRDGRPVLDRVTLAVEAGEVVALVGPNGAGKTSALRLLAGLEAPSEGKAIRPVGGIGYVPQGVNEAVFPWFSVLDNAALPRLIARLPDALAVARALLEQLLPGIDPARRAAALSGGERQALAIVRALAAPGALVLADEPFSALNSALRAKAHQVMRQALKGRALVLVTHELADAQALGARVVRLRDGAVDAG